MPATLWLPGAFLFIKQVFLLFFVDNFVGTRRNAQRLRMLLNIRIDMADTFLFQYLVYSYQNARFLHIAKTIVDSGAKHSHGRTQAHIRIDQWRYVIAQLSDFTVQDAIVVFERFFAEESLQFVPSVSICRGFIGMMRLSGSLKCFFKK